MFLEDMYKTTASEMIYFSTKSYIVTPHWNRLTETVLVRGHNICLNGKIRIIIHKLSFLIILLVWSSVPSFVFISKCSSFKYSEIIMYLRINMGYKLVRQFSLFAETYISSYFLSRLLCIMKGVLPRLFTCSCLLPKLGRRQIHADSLCRKQFFADSSLGKKQKITQSLQKQNMTDYLGRKRKSADLMVRMFIEILDSVSVPMTW